MLSKARRRKETAMDSATVEKISQRVCRQYPEMRGARPSVAGSGEQYTLVYRAKVETPAGPMARIVRVVADGKGRVLRMSTSK
jgi:hypothetical protein